MVATAESCAVAAGATGSDLDAEAFRVALPFDFFAAGGLDTDRQAL